MVALVIKLKGNLKTFGAQLIFNSLSSNANLLSHVT